MKIGVISGPETRLMESVREIANHDHRLKIEIVMFNDFLTPYMALEKRQIDAHAFTHKLALDNFLAIRNSPLVQVNTTFVFPMAGYSSKIKGLADLATYARVAIPDDPANQGRALLLLEKQGLIHLAHGVGLLAQPADIVYNPKRLRFIEMDNSLLCRSINDVDMVVLNSVQASTMRLYPLKDGLFFEDRDSPYANVVVVRKEDKDKPWLKQLIFALRSEAAFKAAEAVFKDTVLRAAGS